MKPAAARVLARLEAALSTGFAHAANPFHHLGALVVAFLWVALVTGIYLFIFYRTSLDGAWASVQALSVEQRYIGGIMRSVHRYASDAALVCLLAHALRELVRGRFRGPRWFSWTTGSPLFWLLVLFGITGYWMVWDELALYVADASAGLLDALPVFSEPMRANFLADAALGSRLFTLIAFIHLVGLPVVAVLAIWFHLVRVRFPNIHPPRRLWLGSLAMLLVLALAAPVQSHAPADLAQVPGPLAPDWFYLAAFPLAEWTGPGGFWLLATGLTLAFAALPLLPGGRPGPAAQVHLPDCSGCGYCADDCPYGAIDMVARSDGRNFPAEARVDPALCVACGICLGSCPSSSLFRRRRPLISGIELPDWSFERLRMEIEALAKHDVLVIGCDHGVELERLEGVGRLSLPCLGMLPVSALDYALRRQQAEGVLLAGCARCDCHHRLGERWTAERLAWQRPPALRRRVERKRLELSGFKPGQQRALERALARFRRRLARLDRGAPA